jgi:hypothetical protein
MSGPNPIQNSPVNMAPITANRAAKATTTQEEVVVPQDSVVTTSPAPAPQADDSSVITVRMKVKNELLQPDPNTGKSKLDDLEPDFVPKEQKSPNAPVVLTALSDPAVPDGYTPISTVALVPNDKAADPTLQETHYPAFVPKDGYILGQTDVDNFAHEQQAVGFNKGLGEGFEKGKKEAVPAGFRPKLMDSAPGLKIEAKRDQFAGMLTMVGSSSSALGISAGIGIPAQYAGPLALATAPLAILGPTGTMSTMAKLEHQKAALLESVAADNPGKDPLQVTVDMNPHTQLPITTEEAVRNIDLMKKTQKMKTVGSLLLAGAGVAVLGGWGTAATALAVGSLASPLADSIPTFDKIGQVRDRKKELKGILEAHDQAVKTAEESGQPAPAAPMVTVQVPVLNEQGQPVGIEPKEIPATEALEHVQKQQKVLALGAIGAVAQAGTMVAMGLGAPIMIVIGASVAIPLLARGALFPKESWETLKALPGNVWDGIKAIGSAIARKLGFGKDDEGGVRDPGEMSEAQQQLFKTLEDIGDKNPELAKQLQETLAILSTPPTNEEQQKAAIEAGPRHDAALKELQANYPELAAQFEGDVKALIAEGAAEAEQAQIEAAHDQVEKVVESELSQSLLNSDRVQAATNGDQELGESVIRIMAQAQVFGNDDVYQSLLASEATDADAKRQLTVYRAIAEELNVRQNNNAA